MVEAIVDSKEEFAGDLPGQIYELVEVDSVGIVFKYCVSKPFDLVAVFQLEIHQLHSGKGSLIYSETLAVTLLYLQRNIPENNLGFLLGDEFVVVVVKYSEGDVHLLLKGTHKKFKEKSHKFVMVNSLVSIFIYKPDESVSNQLRKIQVLLRPNQG